MVRRDDEEGSQDSETSRCASPAGESPAPVTVGGPGSRSPESRETSSAEARRQKPSNGKQGRGPQHEVKLAASTDSQRESRAAHATAKATSSAGRSETTAEDLSGVRSAARVQGEARNTGDPSAQSSSGQRISNRPMAKRAVVQRKSEGIVVPTMTVPQNTVGGKDPWGGHDDVGREHKGMVATGEAGVPVSSQPNSPGPRLPAPARAPASAAF